MTFWCAKSCCMQKTYKKNFYHSCSVHRDVDPIDLDDEPHLVGQRAVVWLDKRSSLAVAAGGASRRHAFELITAFAPQTAAAAAATQLFTQKIVKIKIKQLKS